MSTRFSVIKGSLLAVVATLALGAGNAWAQHAGGGGFHGGGGGGAVHGGVMRGSPGGYHGGGYGGYRGGYGYRGGWGGRYYGGYYGGWHGYYGGWHGGWGWGWGWGCCGVGLGWWLPVLPLGYATYYWGGIPYYYADSNYYVWDSSANQYQAVDPPTGLTTTPSASAAAAPGGSPSNYSASWTDLFAYPKGGQSLEQQTRDRDECRTWAVGQSGFDPNQPGGDPKDAAAKREGYLRAEGACLEARNYSVK